MVTFFVKKTYFAPIAAPGPGNLHFIRTDNRPATNVMETGYSQKLVPYERAIGMRVGLFRDCILSGIVLQEWVPSSQNAADALTKRLGPCDIAKARALFGREQVLFVSSGHV